MTMPHTRFPRQIRRGLIEATTRAASPAGVRADFPGRFACASLKPARRCDLVRASVADFPGRFAGASLKHDI